MHLPHELVVLVTQNLGRRDLKSARLVSKLWCSCASESLFTTIYVSANKIDLDAFNAITSDPVLSTCVRRLIYDGTVFMLDYTKTAYLDKLRSQIYLIFSGDANRLSDFQGHEIYDWITAIVGKHQPDSEATIEWLGDSKFITQGYEKYHEHALYQHHSLRSGSFVDSLAQGLRKLSLLSSIGVKGEWAVSSDGYPLGSPLSRNWDPLHTYPTCWVWEDASVTVGHYFIIVSALVRAQRKLQDFSIASWIPPEVFNRSDSSKPSILGLDVVAFAGLESLDLSFASWSSPDRILDASSSATNHWVPETPEKCPNIDGLRIMLSSMTQLKALYLCLPADRSYECHQVFPEETIWTQLEILKLIFLSSKATDLLDLLTFQIPKLQDLRIDFINLSDDIWEGVIECLKQYSKLSEFQTQLLRPNDGYACQCHDHEHEYQHYHECQMSWEKEVSRYVVHGGRHPSLMPGQPDSAAEDFAKDLKPFLRCCGSSQSARIADA